MSGLKRVAKYGGRYALAALIAMTWSVGWHPAAAQEEAAQGGPIDCVIEPRQVVELGSAENGVVRELLVDRGDTVEEGEAVARLDYDLQALALELATLNAERKDEVRSSRAQLDYRRREAARIRQLHEKNIVSTKQLDEAQVETRLADYSLRAAQVDQRVAEVERRLAEARLERRTIRSPVSGVVVELTMSPGELTHDQAPLMTIAQIDPLNVEVFVPIDYYGQISEGMEVAVLPGPPVNGSHTARVEVVDRVLDTASGTFGVRLRLPNPDHALPAGVKCQVRFPFRTADVVRPDGPETESAVLEPPEFETALELEDEAAIEPAAAPAGDMPETEPETPRAAWSNKALVYLIQTKLADAGYDPGPLDGVLGDQTTEAIRAYQAQAGLEVDGQPSLELFNALRQAAAPTQQ